MKDLRNYILVGIITAIIIYLVSPYIFGNSVVILETNNQELSSGKNLSYSNIFQKVNKSVVSIYTRKSATRNNIFFIDPRERALKKKQYNRIGQGSGVIVSRQGHIITNFHVIAGSEEILIQDYKGNEYGTSVIGIEIVSGAKSFHNSSNLSLNTCATSYSLEFHERWVEASSIFVE